MEVVIDGMVVAEEVTMVEAWTGLITVGRGEATVVGINMFGVTASQSLGYYNVWVTLPVATLQLLVVCLSSSAFTQTSTGHDLMWRLRSSETESPVCSVTTSGDPGCVACPVMMSL